MYTFFICNIFRQTCVCDTLTLSLSRAVCVCSQWPERIFHCESGVTALDFSASNGSQLAVGMNDGSIATYNVQSTEDSPVIDSRWGYIHSFELDSLCGHELY